MGDWALQTNISIEAAEGIPALPIQRPGFRTVIQMLTTDAVLGGGTVSPGDTGHRLSTPFRTRDSPAEHGLCTRLR